MKLTDIEAAVATVCVAILVVTALLRFVTVSSPVLVLLAGIGYLALAFPAALVLGKTIRHSSNDTH